MPKGEQKEASPNSDEQSQEKEEIEDDRRNQTGNRRKEN